MDDFSQRYKSKDLALATISCCEMLQIIIEKTLLIFPLQVQYHDGKKKEGCSPRVEGYLKELEKDIHKRERFLR